MLLIRICYVKVNVFVIATALFVQRLLLDARSLLLFELALLNRRRVRGVIRVVARILHLDCVQKVRVLFWTEHLMRRPISAEGCAGDVQRVMLHHLATINTTML